MIESSCTLEDDSLRVVAYCRMTTRCCVLQDDLSGFVHYRIVEDTNRQVGCPRMNRYSHHIGVYIIIPSTKAEMIFINSFAREPV
jgi:hypothetical protein